MHRIKELRKENKMTQEELADILGLKGATVSSWELGLAGLSERIIEKLTKIFGVSADYLLGFTDERGNYTYTPSLSEEDERVLEYYKRLSDEDKYYIMGKMVELYRESENPTVGKNIG